MKFCKYCGYKLDNEAKFCPCCGEGSNLQKIVLQMAASTCLTEMQGFSAEYYEKEHVDLESIPPQKGPNTGNNYDMSLSDFDLNDGDMIVIEKPEDTHHDFTESDLSATDNKAIYAKVKNGIVIKFSYCNGEYYVNWKQETGWGEIGTEHKVE